MSLFSIRKRGFTLVELLIAIAVIGILVSVFLATIDGSRKKARDTQRVSDITQIQTALRVYNDTEGEYPEFDNGVVISPGSAFANELGEYFPQIPKDPISSASEGYEYYYDSEFDCGSVNPSNTPGGAIPVGTKVVVYAKKVETTGAANWSKICGNAVSGSTQTYGVILGGSN